MAAQVIAYGDDLATGYGGYGYNMRYATGVLAASGTITQLAPSSLVLIVLADQLKTQSSSADVGSMYLGAVGAIFAANRSIYALHFCLKLSATRLLATSTPKRAHTARLSAMEKCLMGIIPSAVLIFLVLGTIMTGIATPTESGAMGAMGAACTSLVKKVKNS